MSNRTHRTRERSTPCWQGKAHRETFPASDDREIVTAARREEVRRLALDEPEKFVRLCRIHQVASLAQFPWWGELKCQDHYAAAQLELLARGAGVGVR